MTVASPPSKTQPLSRAVTSLLGVGPERASLLARLGIRSVEDLILHRPRRHEDRRDFRPIADLQLDEPVIARGTVLALGVKWFKRHTKSIFELILDDGTARLHCRWWNLPYMEKYFATGDEVVVFGKARSLKPRTMDHPETEVVEGGEERFIHLGRITPIYPLTEGLTQRFLRNLIFRTLEDYEEHIHEPPGGVLEKENGSGNENGRGGFDFLSRARAFRLIHFPETLQDIELARRRLALDEFVELQRQMKRRRQNLQARAQGIPCGGDNRLMKPFLGRLDFKLTEAQMRVLRDLRKEMSGAHPMRRLLQGDVGSGKTIVAACCALMAIESGQSVVLMAPTAILAEQHFSNFTRWFEPLEIPIGLRTSSSRIEADSSRTQGLFKTQNPAAQNEVGNGGKGALIIGTHALIDASFAQENLGLVIIDEQHKFGVTQRERLVRKGRYPHLLVMTATPIPRTLGLTLYADLDLSTIDQLPPGRGRIQTFVRGSEALSKVWSFVRSQLEAGRQAYVVYPRVEETAEPDLKAVTKQVAELRQTLAPFKVGLVHGRLANREKESVMEAFRKHALDVLVATSVIEVGVDVPNASVMVIENAEQFGLAQLHQLRGRIGRGAHHSYCVLVAAAKTKEARQRLHVLEETTDGFRIAEADLRLRGPGELLGQQQSGTPTFVFGDFNTDLDLIEHARYLAAKCE